ncbi:MAG: mechanosensitive ion channel family protein [Candidatus Uhrbacteria bacterium]|nr:mechanosensitive ion channel family protein [Patescibacteria group bacterium]MBU1907260.1 mechanosensitive ion channel family protein [Patescibacteria group bacterium]
MDLSNPYLVAVIIMIGSVVGAQLVAWIFQGAGKLASKSKTKLDDYLIKAIAKIIRLGLVIAGVLYAVWYIWPEATVGPYPLSDLYLVIGFIWGGVAAHRIVKAISAWYADEMDGRTGKETKTVFSFVESLLAIGIWAVVLMLILQRFGVEIGPLLAGLGIAGIALAFGLQDTLKGIFSALYIAVDQPIRIGDYVQLSDGTEGVVEDISWRSVRLTTLAENVVVIPNAILAGMIITNFHLPKARTGLVIPFGVAYGADLDKVEKAAVEVAHEVMKEVTGIEDYEPSFRVYELADSSINCKVIVRSDQFANRALLMSELMRALKKRFDQEKIEIPFPQIDVHTKK